MKLTRYKLVVESDQYGSGDSWTETIDEKKFDTLWLLYVYMFFVYQLTIKELRWFMRMKSMKHMGLHYYVRSF